MSRNYSLTSRSHVTRMLLLGLVVLVVAPACIGRLGRTRDPFGGGGAREGRGGLRVEVQNLNFNDVTLFAVRSGQQIRLGQVTGKSDRNFDVEWDFAVPISFRINLVGGQQCRTNELGADPGSRIRVQIPANIGLTPCRASQR